MNEKAENTVHRHYYQEGMKNTDRKTGWITSAWVENKANTTYAFYNEFKDESTGKKLDKFSLFVSKVNFKHRGNETDELLCYNRESTPEEFINVWNEWDVEREDAIQDIKSIALQYGIKISIK